MRTFPLGRPGSAGPGLHTGLRLEHRCAHGQAKIRECVHTSCCVLLPQHSAQAAF